MARRSSARWLAPVALVACTAAVYAVVSAGSGDGGGHPTTTVNPRHAAERAPKHRFYTVKAGDVLSAIAEHTGVSVETLMTLNPDVDAQTLHPGERLRLYR